MIADVAFVVLPPADWRQRADQHRARSERHTGPARMRSDRGLPHPIVDFLFEYYPFPFSLLESWHPGIGFALEDDSPALPDHFSARYYTRAGGLIIPDPCKLSEKDFQRMEWTVSLLEATRERAPNLACHGLHEWAMVYRGKEVRHERTLTLRLPQEDIDALVESRPICCSHYDAFRFFAEEARPFNRLQPDLDSRHLLEQPGCLHANMDLYKWAAKAMPWVGSELLMDCFELAVELRELDMRASPYDLTGWDRQPVRIETAEGRWEYEKEQKRLAALARPLRNRLIDTIQRTISSARQAADLHTPCQPSF